MFLKYCIFQVFFSIIIFVYISESRNQPLCKVLTFLKLRVMEITLKVGESLVFTEYVQTIFKGRVFFEENISIFLSAFFPNIGC